MKTVLISQIQGRPDIFLMYLAYYSQQSYPVYEMSYSVALITLAQL